MWLLMFLDIQVLREKQMTVSRDLEEKQTTCLQLQTTADELEVQIDTLSEERQRVSNLMSLTTSDQFSTPLRNISISSRNIEYIREKSDFLARFDLIVSSYSVRIWLT